MMNNEAYDSQVILTSPSAVHPRPKFYTDGQAEFCHQAGERHPWVASRCLEGRRGLREGFSATDGAGIFWEADHHVSFRDQIAPLNPSVRRTRVAAAIGNQGCTLEPGGGRRQGRFLADFRLTTCKASGRSP